MSVSLEKVAVDTMRVCIVNEFFYPDDTGGTGTVLSELTRALIRDFQDVEIEVITSDKLYRDWSARLPAYSEWNGVRIFRLNTPHPGGHQAGSRLFINALFGLRALGRLLRQGRYDMILVGTAPPTVAMAASLYKLLTGTPYVYVIYDLDPDRAVAMNVLSSYHPLVPVLRWLQRGWLHAAERTVVLGRCMQEHVNRVYGVPTERIETIAIGGDDEAIRPLDRQTRFRKQHGLSGFILAYTGNFGRYHDFDTLLDAARDLREQGAEMTFALVGDGVQRPHIACRIAEEGLSNVRLFPFVAKEDYADLLASADASFVTLEPGMEGLCVPSKFYSILASGRPTVAMMSPTSEVARVIQETECGIRVNQGDVHSLTAALLHLKNNPTVAAAMGHNARQVLEEHYGNRQVAKHYHSLMHTVAMSKPVREKGIWPLPSQTMAYKVLGAPRAQISSVHPTSIHPTRSAEIGHRGIPVYLSPDTQPEHKISQTEQAT